MLLEPRFYRKNYTKPIGTMGAGFLIGVGVDNAKRKLQSHIDETINSALSNIDNAVDNVIIINKCKAPNSVAHATPEAYAGVRQASQYLRETGVPRHIRKQVLESFDRQAIRVRVAGEAEYGIRYFDNINAWPKGRYLFEQFPATRNSLALPPNWNQMTHFKQFQIRPGTIILEGPAARQGFYPGGQIQKYIANLDDLLNP